MRARILQFVLVLGCGSSIGARGLAEEPPLVRFSYRDTSGLQSIAGVLREAGEEHLRVFDLRTYQERSFDREAIRALVNPAREADVVARVGPAPLASWLIARALPPQPKPGRIASVDVAVAYVNLGGRDGIRTNDRLDVFRGEEEIRDPETGEVLGRKQRRIGTVEVIEVRDKLSKVKLVSSVEIDLEVGDTVRPTSVQKSVAVLEFRAEDGLLSEGGRRIADDLTAYLAKSDVPLVERSKVVEVLAELALQQSTLFDAETVQRIGKQAAAYAVVTGNIQIDGRQANVSIRLIEVQTGKVLYAGSFTIRNVEPFLQRPTRAVPSTPRDVRRVAGPIRCYWPLDGDLENRASNSFHGAGVGTLEFADGKLERALQLLGRANRAYVRVQQKGEPIVGTGDFTLAAWIRPSGSERRWPIAGQGVWGTQGWTFEVLPSGQLYFESWDEANSDNGSLHSSARAIQFSSWQHVAVAVKRSASGAQTRLYINGGEVACGNVRGGNIESDSMCIGRIHDDYVAGLIDDVRLYRECLGAREVAALAGAAE